MNGTSSGRFWLYALFIGEGLWRSEDSGASWQRLPVTPPDRACNATALVIAGSRLLLLSEPLWWTGVPTRTLLSHDDGASWQDVQDAALGAVRWKHAALDGRGRAHLASCGNGMFHLEEPFAGAAPAPPGPPSDR